jgi:hypothetical protein
VTVREILASLGDMDEEAEVFIVTSSDGTHIDGKVELEHVEELPLLGGEPVIACIPRFSVRPHEGAQPMLRLARTDDNNKPAA